MELVGPLLPLLRRSNFWEGVDPFQILGNFSKHAVELG